MPGTQTPRTSSTSDAGQLKELLFDLANQQQEIHIRLQLNGKFWLDHFANVLVFSKHAILLTHMPTRTVIHIPDLKDVTGFEINRAYKRFSHFHRYTIHS